MAESTGTGGGLGPQHQGDEIVVPSEGLRRSEIYHVVKEVIGFVLYMHQQIPAVLQRLEEEYDNLKEEWKDLEGSMPSHDVPKAHSRMHRVKIREVKRGTRRLEKLMNAVSSLLSSLRLILDEVPLVHSLTLVLGGSLVRPQYVYEMFFSQEEADSDSSRDGNRSKLVESISKKAIRNLISKGAGGSSYAGPMKLFLMVKGPDTLKLPLHFLPKREFKYHRKAVPFRLNFRSKAVMVNSSYSARKECSSRVHDVSSSDSIWFQCRHSIKGSAMGVSPTES